jgi:hypothetical protein
MTRQICFGGRLSPSGLGWLVVNFLVPRPDLIVMRLPRLPSVTRPESCCACESIPVAHDVDDRPGSLKRRRRQPAIFSLASGDTADQVVCRIDRQSQDESRVQANEMTGNGLNRLFTRLAGMLHCIGIDTPLANAPAAWSVMSNALSSPYIAQQAGAHVM